MHEWGVDDEVFGTTSPSRVSSPHVFTRPRPRVQYPPMQNYRVQLDSYSGPMDLLLYLIRREEVDIYDIPISRILDQYIQYVRLLEVMDPDGVGEFLVLAATLMEVKSRLLLPKPPPEEAEGDWL